MTVICNITVTILLGQILAQAPYRVPGKVLKERETYYIADFSAALKQNILVDSPNDYNSYVVDKKDCQVPK